MPRRRGGGGRWTSLHESTSVCPPLLIPSHLIPAPCTDFTTYIFCIPCFMAISHQNRSHTHTHTHTHTLYLSLYSHTNKHTHTHTHTRPFSKQRTPTIIIRSKQA